MRYSDYDILLKYSLYNDRNNSIYTGDPSIYEDGRTLETMPEDTDKVNGCTPLFVVGTVVYLCYGDKVLLLKQKKPDRVVDTLVGLGGKMKLTIGDITLKEEKNDISRILRAYETGQLETFEEIKNAAAREVMEETSTYSKDENGNYTHEIIKEGLHITPSMLNTIGISRIRIIEKSKTESWLITNYIYPITDEEYSFIQNEVCNTNREGDLQWLTLDEALPRMSFSDRIILKNLGSQGVTVSEIRDNVNNNNITSFNICIKDDYHSATLINDNFVNVSDELCYSLFDINGQPGMRK